MGLVRARLAWPPLVALALAAATHADYGDNLWFLGPGKTLLSSHWLDVYADPGVQAGPIQLALYGAAACRRSGWHRSPWSPCGSCSTRSAPATTFLGIEGPALVGLAAYVTSGRLARLRPATAAA